MELDVDFVVIAVVACELDLFVVDWIVWLLVFTVDDADVLLLFDAAAALNLSFRISAVNNYIKHEIRNTECWQQLYIRISFHLVYLAKKFFFRSVLGGSEA